VRHEAGSLVRLLETVGARVIVADAAGLELFRARAAGGFFQSCRPPWLKRFVDVLEANALTQGIILPSRDQEFTRRRVHVSSIGHHIIEHAPQPQERRFQAMVESAPEAIIVYNFETFLYLNR